MTAVSRRLLATSAGAALLFAIAGIADGCAGSVDCNDTATCPASGDDVADLTVDAGDDVTGGTLDRGDSEGLGDGADVGTDTPVEADSAADANDAPVEAPLVDRGVDMGAGDADAGKDAPFDAEAEASVPTCLSNVLAPTAAVASSVNGANVAAKAIDQIFTTRWESVQGIDPQWIYLDFGAAVFIDRVRILWEACATNYDLQTSNDATAWTTMHSIVGNTLELAVTPTDWSSAVDSPGFTGVGRYMRINGTTRCTSYGYSIWEMQVYGDTNAGCHP